MLAARENTVIDNPYQSSLIRSAWNRTTNNVQPIKVPITQPDELAIPLKDEAYENLNEQDVAAINQHLMSQEQDDQTTEAGT